MSSSPLTLYVDGMHCASCVVYLQETLVEHAGVETVRADLGTCTVTVSGSLQEEPAGLARALTQLVQKRGYRLSVEPLTPKRNGRDFLIAIPAALTVIIGFLLLQQLGFVNLVTTSEVSYGTAILIGLIASVSTCLAVVGGLVLSLSASAAKSDGHRMPHVMFHVGRLGGFFLLGGVIGTAGNVFKLSVVGSTVLGILVALVMLVLGLNLLDTFPRLKRIQPKLPAMFARHTIRTSRSSHVFAPLLVGIGTFFLPCGFTQSMQVYTLTTGSFLTGGLTMLAFALGTLPVLALLSFGALEISERPWKGAFLKAAGIVVIALALYNIWNALSVILLLTD